jgi:hypothetical protein
MNRLILLLLLILYSCASLGVHGGGSLVSGTLLNKEGQEYKRKWTYEVDHAGRLHLCYYTKDGDVRYRHPDGGEIGLLQPEEKGRASGVSIEVDGDYVYVIWREKLRGKRLKLRRSLDGGKTFEPAIVIDEDSEPLSRIRIESKGQNLYLLWLGEKSYVRKRSEYYLYFKYSTDHGKSFSKTYRVLQGIYPAWIVDKDGVYVFSWTGKEGRLYMAMRRFNLLKGELEEEIKIKDAPQIAPYFEAFRSGERFFLMWLVTRYDDKDFLLEGVYSDDKGRSWKSFSFDALKGVDMSKVDVSHDDSGHIYIAVSGRKRVRGAKEKVYLFRSEDNGTTWMGPITLRHYSFDNTKARLPHIASNGNGEVVVVWEDWREIRPGIYLNYSRDYGATWQEEDIPLTFPGRESVGFNPLVGCFFYSGGSYYLIAERYKDDAFRDRDLIFYKFNPYDLKRLPSSSERWPGKFNEGYLRQRVRESWDAFMNNDYKKAFSLSDPFFRARNRVEDYLIRRGRIKYHNYRINEIEIEGNVAKVNMEIEYSVPRIRFKGEVFSKPKTKVRFVERWVFVYDDWYKEYYEEMSGVRYARY